MTKQERLDMVTSIVMFHATAGMQTVPINLHTFPDLGEEQDYLSERCEDLARKIIHVTQGRDQHEDG